jgi:NADPH:quinone reductase-like Zn-dependent oxidoreductase
MLRRSMPSAGKCAPATGRITSLFPLPFIPGWDVSGVVEAIVPGVAKFKRGDEVYARPDVAAPGYGGVCRREGDRNGSKPRLVDHVHAAATPVGAVTAWRALLDTASLEKGQEGLIHRAAGGVGSGSFAVLLAKWAGEHVFGTASSRNQEFLGELGADEPIDYQKTKFEDVVQDIRCVRHDRRRKTKAFM